MTTKASAARWLQGVGFGAAIVVAPAMSLLIGVLLAPAIAAAMLDSTPGRPLARATILISAATAVGPGIRLISGSNTLNEAIAISCDPVQLMLSWLSAAGGWTIAEATSTVTLAVTSTIIQRRARILSAERDALISEWGNEAAPI